MSSSFMSMTYKCRASIWQNSCSHDSCCTRPTAVMQTRELHAGFVDIYRNNYEMIPFYIFCAQVWMLEYQMTTLQFQSNLLSPSFRSAQEHIGTCTPTTKSLICSFVKLTLAECRGFRILLPMETEWRQNGDKWLLWLFRDSFILMSRTWRMFVSWSMGECRITISNRHSVRVFHGMTCTQCFQLDPHII